MSRLILVCGSRGWKDRVKVWETLDSLGLDPDDVIMHGGARGADRLAGEWASEHGYVSDVYHPDYKRYGSKAPIMRDIAMLDRCPSFVVAFWDGTSSGTGFVISEARMDGIPVQVVEKEDS